MKDRKILERVYNPGRLRGAWQRVRKNAGVAGIDKMLTFLNCFTKNFLEQTLFSR